MLSIQRSVVTMARTRVKDVIAKSPRSCVSFPGMTVSVRVSGYRRMASTGGKAVEGGSKHSVKAAEATAMESSASAAPKVAPKVGEGAAKEGLWHSARFWGAAGALAGWGMSFAAIYDAVVSSPEVISLNMTGVLIVYSSLFARWAWIVRPRNLLLMGCHLTNIVAQLNQVRRALHYKADNGEQAAANDIAMRAAATAAAGAACVVLAPTLRSAIVASNLGVLSTVAASEAGPFTVHFWAPMSKWLISGASFLDLHRPTDKISIAQYTALTFTGFFFSRYALLVHPINYMLCSVNVALFGSSAWHLGRKVNADYIQGDKGVDSLVPKNLLDDKKM